MTSLYRVDGIPVTKMVSSDERKVNRLSLCLRCKKRQNKKPLHPQKIKNWESQGCKKHGTWQEVFGADIYTDEIFMAWHYARYVERMAQTARSIYNVPLYVNAAVNSR